MRPKVGSRARRRGDRAGDPLDGLVNLFDLGIVLAVAFLIAALQSVNLTELLTQRNVTLVRTDPGGGQTLIVKEGDQIRTVRLTRETATGSARRVGDVFRLADGRLVYVERGAAPAGSGAPTTTAPVPAPAPTTTTPP
ncbi:MAG TPA: DUF2149 domain-containing protein [Solirubrobacteraceae bacterium]|nr:DUF2149 domain-containing protein [Solirubrobacteraceae bacterium]